MKVRSLHLAVVAALLLVVSEAPAESPRVPTSPRFKVGVSVALTGPAAAYSTDIRDAVLLAADELGNGEFEIIVEDDKCSPKDAVTIAKKFIEVDRVSAAIGSSCSGAAMAAAPLYARAGIPQLLPNAAASRATDAGELTFALNPGNAPVAAILAERIARDHRKVGMITDAAEFPNDVKDHLVLNLKAAGVETVLEEMMPDDSDPRPAILRLKGRGVDAVVLNPLGEGRFADALKKIREMKWQVPVFGTYFGSSSTFRTLAGPLADGIVFGARASAEEMAGERGKSLLGRFTARFGVPKSVDDNLIFAYECFRVAAAFARSPDRSRERLSHTEYPGLFGPYDFRAGRRLLDLPVTLREVRDGKEYMLEMRRGRS